MGMEIYNMEESDEQEIDSVIMESLQKKKLRLEIMELKKPFFLKAAFWGFLGVLITAFITDYPNRLKDDIKALSSCIELATNNSSNVLVLEQEAFKKGLDAIEKESANLFVLVEEAESRALDLSDESQKFPMDAKIQLDLVNAAAEYFARLNNANDIFSEAKFNLSLKLNKEKNKALARISENLKECGADI